MIHAVHPRELFGELKRRKVYRVAVAYTVVSWLLIQVATQVFPFLEIPSWIVRLVIILLALGFPLALALSWAFDWTPTGVQRTPDLKTSGKEDAQQSVVSVSSAISPPAIPLKSVAVLPFENLSEARDNAFFAEGVHDDVLASLAKIADLKVISRTSVQQYKAGNRNLREIARELGVAHILEGTARRSGNRIRVNAQLVNAQTDTHVWSETFDRELTDLFAVQSELAERITIALRANLSPQEKANLQVRPTTDLAAYELYLRARSFFRWSGVGDAEESAAQALPLLDQAIAHDPGFALAYSLRSRVHAELYWFGFDREPSRIALARTAAEDALRLQPGLGEAHLALAFYHYYSHRDYDAARRELAIAQRATPNDADVIGALGVIDRRQHRWEEATAHLERACELDPRNVAALWNLLETYVYRGRYDDADRAITAGLLISPNAHFLALARGNVALRRNGDTAPLRLALRLIPSTFDPGGAVTTIAIRVALIDRNYDEAAQRLDRSRRDLYNDIGLSGMAGTIDGYAVPRSWYVGLIAQGRGETGAAHEAFQQAREKIGSDEARWRDDPKAIAMLALVNTALGNREEALHLNARAVELLPTSRDALDGVVIATNHALVCAGVGQHESALSDLARLLQLPAGPTPGLLRVEPEWAPLRGHPQFQKLAGG